MFVPLSCRWIKWVAELLLWKKKETTLLNQNWWTYSRKLISESLFKPSRGSQMENGCIRLVDGKVSTCPSRGWGYLIHKRYSLYLQRTPRDRDEYATEFYTATFQIPADDPIAMVDQTMWTLVYLCWSTLSWKGLESNRKGSRSFILFAHLDVCHFGPSLYSQGPYQPSTIFAPNLFF